MNENEFKQLYTKLGSTRKLASYLGIGKSTIARYKKQYGNMYANMLVGSPNQRLARKAELWFLERFGGKDVTGKDDKAPFDILWRGLKVNVKASKRNIFDVNSLNPRRRFCADFCDAFVLCKMDENEQVIDVKIMFSDHPKFRCQRITFDALTFEH